jgi:DNA-binding response OmpR family regulator
MDFNNHPDFAERPSKTDKFKAILVVDDDRQLVQALQWILADQNFMVDKAHDGLEALLKVRANEYDAVICDVMMPNQRGDDFFYKAIQIRPSLVQRFIFITGYADDRRTHLFLCQNHLKYIVKPFPIRDLIDCVKDIIFGVASTSGATDAPPESFAQD